jgi:hypothetical protein
MLQPLTIADVDAREPAAACSPLLAQVVLSTDALARSQRAIIENALLAVVGASRVLDRRRPRLYHGNSIGGIDDYRAARQRIRLAT